MCMLLCSYASELNTMHFNRCDTFLTFNHQHDLFSQDVNVVDAVYLNLYVLSVHAVCFRTVNIGYMVVKQHGEAAD